MVFNWTFRVSDLAIVVATLFGPVFAVQAQKFVERRREQKQRRIAVFRALMTTRAVGLSPAHVEALNIVPIEFYGNANVVDAWKVYINHLYQSNEMDQNLWGLKRTELLNAMLAKMGATLGYKFNDVEISREVYSPKGHAVIESEQTIIREGLAKVFRGECAIPMDVTSFPVDSKLVQSQQELQKALLELLGGQRSLRVTSETKHE